MCHRRVRNNMINHLREQCLNILYSDKQLTFEELLEKYTCVTTHERNLRYLAIEIFRVIKGLSPPIVFILLMKGILSEKWEMIEKSFWIYFYKTEIKKLTLLEKSVELWTPLPTALLLKTLFSMLHYYSGEIFYKTGLYLL